MPGPFAVMRAARLVFAQSGRQGPRLFGLVAAHTCSPHCPGWCVAPGPMTRRCSHLMMIAPRRPPGGNRGMSPAARRPVWVSVQPSAGPIARCSFAYAIFPPFSFPHAPPCQPPACSRKAAAQWHARRNRQLETDCRQTGHSHVNVLQGSEPGCGAPYNRDAFEYVYSTKCKPTAATGRKHQVVYCRPVCSICQWAVVQNQLPSICELFRRCRPQSEERAWRATPPMRL